MPAAWNATVRSRVPGLVAALSWVVLTADPVPIRWQAQGPTCPSATEVETRLRSLTGARTVELNAEVEVTRVELGWRARLRMHWHGQVDERTFEGPDCTTVADATVLLVAAMADPLVASRATVPVAPLPAVEPIVPIEAPSTPPVGPPRPPPELPAVAAPKDRGPSVSLGALVDRGSLPGLGTGPTLTLGWRTPSLRFRVGGLYLPPRRVQSTASYATSARVQLGAARLHGCVRLGGARIEIPLCALAEGGLVWATRFGERADRGTVDPWVALGPSAGMRVALGSRVALGAWLETLIPLARGEYGHDGDVLHRTEPLVARATLAVEFHWAIQIGPKPENP